MGSMEFANPYYLYGLLLVPLLGAWYWWQDRNRRNAMTYSAVSLLGARSEWGMVWQRHLPMLFRLVGVALLVVALARPQEFSQESSSTTEGIDIMFSLDVSSSMLARDFTPDRIEAAKELGIKFISGRQSDRMGLVIFAGEAFTMCPLTIDHATLINQFNDVEPNMLEDGTAIGSGLAMAVQRLVGSDATSRVVILMTDGVNNSGEIAPYTAAEIAKTYGIRVYVIGIGTEGEAPYPVQTPMGIRYQPMKVHIDEPLMEKIAGLTGGEYFRATDNSSLEEVYARIDALEKSKIHVDKFMHKDEAFMLWALLALLCFAIDVLLRESVLRLLP